MIVPDVFDAADTAWVASFTESGGGSRLPADALVQGLVAVVVYIDEEGCQRFMPYWAAEVPTSQLVGVLEIAKLQLIEDAGSVVPRSGDE